MDSRDAAASGEVWGAVVSVLILVRHGQASFFADDYDCLSPVGETQARRLGDYWAQQGVLFTEVYVGPRRRQRQTAEFVGDQYQRAGLPWPEPITLGELDEYDLSGLMDRLVPGLAQGDRAFGQLMEAYQRSDESERTRSFQRMFEMLLTHWQTEPATLAADVLESWPSFRDRVERALHRMTNGGARQRRVVAFTSGGFIGTAVARTLNAPDRTALELNWRLRNASLTHLLFTPGRVTLDDFNTMPHLPDPAQWTYR